MDEKEAALLKKRLCELDNRSRQGGFALYSDFLDLYGQDIFWSLKLRDAHLLGGYDGADRKVACFCGDSPPLCFVKIAPKNKKFAAAMSHRDILGSLMGLGLRRETLGDIIVGEKDGTVVCLKKVADFIVENLTSVGRTSVVCSLFDGEDFTSEREPEQKTVFTSSLRADAVIAAVYRLSRSEAAGLIAAQKVFVSGRMVTSPSKEIPINEPISVRGFGRFKLVDVRKTKKDRLRCTAEI